METLYRFNPKHNDLVHDMSFDYFGQRLATCSSDQYIKVWDMKGPLLSPDDAPKDQPQPSPWILNDAWKAHDASVLKVVWAHPEYGQVLASCSFDRSIRIWEEQEFETKGSEKRWMEKARLVDSRGTVQDIEFAPTHLGLKLATIAVDGVLRIYEAMDVINLAHWTLMEDVEVEVNGREKETVYCLSWCTSRFLPPMMVVGCGRAQIAKVYRYEESTRKWIPSEDLGGHDDMILDVAWAPGCGRSYQLIATASKDKHVRIFKLSFDENDQQTPITKRRFQVELVAAFKDHQAEVWRVEWNLTGTVLSSTGDDGRVMLWKANFLGEWACMSAIHVAETLAQTSNSVITNLNAQPMAGQTAALR